MTVQLGIKEEVIVVVYNPLLEELKIEIEAVFKAVI
jgi:hypothetical protein